MRVILYVLMVAAAALNTYHPKKHAVPAAPVQAAKPISVDRANSDAIVFNNSNVSSTTAQSN